VNRKDIEKLFPEPIPTPEPQAREDLEGTIVWYRDASYIPTFTGQVGSRTVELDIRQHPWSGLGGVFRIDENVVTKIFLGGGAVFKPGRDLGIVLGMNDTWRSIGRGTECRGIARRKASGTGEIRLANGLKFLIDEKGPHKVLIDDQSTIIARFMPAWRDSDTAQKIFARTWVSPKLPEEETILVGSLLLLWGTSFYKVVECWP
jgi:hypothetical protein